MIYQYEPRLAKWPLLLQLAGVARAPSLTSESQLSQQVAARADVRGDGDIVPRVSLGQQRRACSKILLRDDSG